MGVCVFDGAVSVETLHHFTHEEKVGLYKKIFKSLKENSFYIETDYIAPNQEYEDYHFSENKIEHKRIKRGKHKEELYHIQHVKDLKNREPMYI